ncbi:family 78 glycoside hydrolase catalytic domain [Galbibacter mesophilus]|uniref:family 78 glycoside hydrolase catalytic domain n=1 Tax=Galbibacter mesophilus TaxID=379069 RepID=UPI00191DCCF0|nr:family 78 glycoside hydrolase catalytic domain [Galbibacter mesophilus]MCM5663071.1 glycoside hydrolase family 78 protein [Galbibacter mesophilus]
MKIRILVKLLIVLAFTTVYSQEKGKWISYPTANVNTYGVYHFRKNFNIEKVPSKLEIQVSADNRYNLFVNGERVAYGPAKGDLKTYKYDVVDIAPYLKNGENLLAALVYNGGADKPLAFLSSQTAFYVYTEDQNFQNIITDNSWKTFKNEAYEPISYYEMIHKDKWFYGFYACGPGDNVTASKYPWDWEKNNFNDQNWHNAQVLAFYGNSPWNLVPRNIPFMKGENQLPKKIRKTTGIPLSQSFISEKQPLKIPAQTKATILFDFERLTMGYPEITFSKGENATVKIKYAEALYEEVNLKAHRDSVNGKTMFGVWDIYKADGAAKRTFRPLWKRTFRYVQLEIETKEQPLEIDSFINEYSGYPYKEMATFESNDQTLNEIFEMSNRTLQMCSAETYYDTPFYEQLSYGGDNRPISAISTYNTTDDRLLREVLRLYPQSKNKETRLFKSAYPSRFDFDMGSWSLAWIQTLDDYYKMRGDKDFVKQFTADIEGVLGYYERHLNEETGILGSVVSQNFIDWSIGKGSIPRKNEAGEINNSVMLTLYYVHTLECTAHLFKELSLNEKAKEYQKQANTIKKNVYKTAWNEEKQLFRDELGKEIYSQHTNILAILCDVIPEEEQKALLQRVLNHKNLTEYASSYFSFFLFKSLEKTGLQHLFLDHLDFWKEYIDRGFTTCGETGFASHDRSDCHAWSAHPSYYLLSLVAGIKPASIGFKSVSIEPHLGNLKTVSAAMPHPKGKIETSYNVKGKWLHASITLPMGLEGTFTFNDEEYNLKPGKNNLKIKHQP